MVAFARGYRVAPVAVVNTFLGWTLLGWVGAFTLAVWERPAQRGERRTGDRRRDA